MHTDQATCCWCSAPQNHLILSYFCGNSQHTKSQPPSLLRSGLNFFLTNETDETHKAIYWGSMLPKKSYPLILYLSPFFLRPISCATFLPPVFMIVFLHCLPPVVLLTGGWHHNFWKIKELLSFQEKIQLFTSSDSLLQFQQKIATGRRKTVKKRIHWTGGQGRVAQNINIFTNNISTLLLNVLRGMWWDPDKFYTYWSFSYSAHSTYKISGPLNKSKTKFFRI